MQATTVTTASIATTESPARAPAASGRARRWIRTGAAVALLAAGMGAAHAGDVRWSIGLNLPLPPLPPLPGVVVRAPVYAPPPRVAYAPPPVYDEYEPAYADGPGYGPAYGPTYSRYDRYDRYEPRPVYRPAYGPEVVVYGRDRHDHRVPRYRDGRGYGHAPVYVQPRVIVRPAPRHRHHGRWD